MTQALWELNKQGRHQAMIDHLILLGCRDPSEYSYRELAILSMVGSDGPQAACSFSVSSKNSVLKLMKRLFKQSASKAPPPEDFIKQLPEHPDELQSFYPNTYALVFGGNPPIACPVDLQVLEYMRNGAFLRRPRGQKVQLGNPFAIEKASVNPFAIERASAVGPFANFHAPDTETMMQHICSRITCSILQTLQNGTLQNGNGMETKIDI